MCPRPLSPLVLTFPLSYKSLRDISSPTKKGNMSVSKQVSGDQDSDGCLIGGCLTAHATRFYELCMHTNPELRRSCVMLIGRLLRQGLINPNDCIPYKYCVKYRKTKGRRESDARRGSVSVKELLGGVEDK